MIHIISLTINFSTEKFFAKLILVLNGCKSDFNEYK